MNTQGDTKLLQAMPTRSIEKLTHLNPNISARQISPKMCQTILNMEHPSLGISFYNPTAVMGLQVWYSKSMWS